MMGKTTGALTWIDGVAPNCTGNSCILQCQACTIKQMPVLCKNVLEEAVKAINFIKSQPLSTYVSFILWQIGKYA